MRCMRCWISPLRSMSCSTFRMACSGYFCRREHKTDARVYRYDPRELIQPGIIDNFTADKNIHLHSRLMHLALGTISLYRGREQAQTVTCLGHIAIK